ncbi:hypothetical protein A2773_01050 [Candidatus Gottesmanbacteria bacterium RIFCSPHIGHO2_01_FULL_39_10]|uniref:Lipopolysaccharide heptosyltransferase II n=1 Tax=Candidatus Gottesmanbacteria bacterium RIFCSPHIGHO2_01_FULL_39_10 TaxID=1798375 RepID=A0A1F5ZLX2_9BACT|nr:MAG: hypothetical protein A2773_01050 [Candidatus Gottesmanbacteria bacterium RIFCSPHIGHO2_01_FULL_39_10]
MKDIQKILIIFKSGIGNFILFTPALQALRKKYPEAKITVLAAPRGAPEILNSLSNLVDRVLIAPQSNWRDILKLIPRLKQIKADIAISTQPGPAGVYLSLISRAKIRLGFCLPDKKWFDSFFTHQTIFSHQQHELLQYFNLLKPLGLSYQNENVIFPITKSNLVKTRRYLIKQNLADKFLIAIHPGSYFDQKFKRWPIDYFSKLAKMLADYYQAKILILGAREEKELARKIQLRFKLALDLTGQFSLAETAAIIKSCRFLVVSDSGLGHIATAVKTPVFSIFGLTNPDKNRPWGENAFVIKHPEAKICYQSFVGFASSSDCKDPRKYLKLLTPKIVFNYIKNTKLP